MAHYESQSLERVYAVDFEGNGDPQPDIVELALVEILDWKDIGRSFCWLLRPASPITKFISRIHGITNEDVINAPPFTDIEDDVRQILDGATLIGHNVRGDIKALERKMPDWSACRILDTLQLARRLKPGLPSYSLQSLTHAKDDVNETGSDRTSRPHSAAYDARAAATLFLRLISESPRHSLATIIDLATVRRDGEQPSFL